MWYIQLPLGFEWLVSWAIQYMELVNKLYVYNTPFPADLLEEFGHDLSSSDHTGLLIFFFCV
jgi:hypothetical protein